MHEFEFRVPLRVFLKNKPFFVGLFKYIKQYQWLGLGNKSTFRKLEKVIEDFDHVGPMREVHQN